MKLGSMSRVLAGVTLALVITGGAAWASPSPQQTSQQQMQQQRQQYEQQQRAEQAREQGEKQPRKKGEKAAPAQPSLYPNATRKSPDLPAVTTRDATQLNSGMKAAAANNVALARKILTPYAEGQASDNKYLQAVALQLLGNMDYKAGDIKQATTRLQKALATNALPNNAYFNVMYELAQFHYAQKQYQPALDLIQKWRSEGKRQTADSYGLEGIIDYQLQKYKDAIAAINKAKSLTKKPNSNWEKVLAVSYAQTGQGGQAIAMAQKQLDANPNDAGMRSNLITLLLNAGKDDQALKAMEKARSLGQLTTSASYMNMAKLYLQAGQDSGKDPRPYAAKAVATLKEGQSKGVIKPDFAYYKLMGDANVIGGFTKAALAAYSKAAPLGHDGTAELSRAQLLASNNKYSASRSAARKALSKGTKHKGRAYMLIAKAERALGDKRAAVTSMKKAAQYAETKSQALAWLKKAGYRP